jgi:hypothetical protein
VAALDQLFCSDMMGRQPRRASGLKALQAIKANSNKGRVTKVSAFTYYSPSYPGLSPQKSSENEAKKQSTVSRSALGDVTNKVSVTRRHHWGAHCNSSSLVCHTPLLRQRVWCPHIQQLVPFPPESGEQYYVYNAYGTHSIGTCVDT